MKNGYKKQFYNILLKKSLREIPRILAVILIVAIISTGVIYAVAKVCGENVTSLNAGYVFEDEDDWFSVGLKYMAKGAHCNLRKFTEEKATRALKKKEIAALLIINDDETIVTEENSSLPVNSIKFIYYDDGQFITSMFGTIISAGISDYLVLNATRDVVKATYDDYSRSKLSDFEDELMDYIIGRNRYYERIVFYDSGDIPIKHYYLGNALSLITLLSASVVIGFSKNDEKNFVKYARRTGLSKFDLLYAKYLPFLGLFSIFNVAAIIAYQLIMWDEIDIPGILSTFLGTLIIMSLITLIHELISDKTISTLCCIFASILFMFISGNLIPLTFLPNIVAQISEFVITKYPSRLYGQAFFGRINGPTIWYSLLYLGVTLGLTVIISFVRGKNEYENT